MHEQQVPELALETVKPDPATMPPESDTLPRTLLKLGPCGPVGPGTVDAGPVGPGMVDAGPVGPGTVDAGPVGPGTVDAGPVGPGIVDAGPVGPGGPVVPPPVGYQLDPAI